MNPYLPDVFGGGVNREYDRGMNGPKRPHKIVKSSGDSLFLPKLVVNCLGGVLNGGISAANGAIWLASTVTSGPPPRIPSVPVWDGDSPHAGRFYYWASYTGSAGLAIFGPKSLKLPARSAEAATADARLSGPVTFRPPPQATAEEIAQVRAYVDGCNAALCDGNLSPSGRVSTQGPLRADAHRAAALERARAAAAGDPYSGHAGHVPDTTWTGSAVPPSWMDLSPRVYSSLGGQAAHYPIGYQPTEFVFWRVKTIK